MRQPQLAHLPSQTINRVPFHSQKCSQKSSDNTFYGHAICNQAERVFKS